MLVLCVLKMQGTKDVKAVCEQAATSLSYSQLKPQQLEVMIVFVVQPTGFGKSLIYASMPLAFDILHATHDSVVVVITPLTAIMKDQVILPMPLMSKLWWFNLTPLGFPMTHLFRLLVRARRGCLLRL